MTGVEITYGDLTPEALEDIGDHAKIHSLDLSGNNITPEYCIELVKSYISTMTNLRSLDMKDNKIGPTGAIFLFEALLTHCPHLTYLDVNENAIQDEALYALALLVKNSKLETLHVVTNHITPRGLPTLCDGISANSTLKELSLSFNVLGDEGAKIVSQMLSTHPALEVLDLSDNHIGDQGMVALAEAFLLSRHSQLRSLNVSVNQIGDVGFKAVGEALTKTQNIHFTALDLGCNDAVGEAGRTVLTKCTSDMRYIRLLDLTSCNLTDADAHRLIAGVRSASSLTSVEWYNNPAMTLPVEKELYEAIELKAAHVEASRSLFSMPSQSTMVCIGAALWAATILTTSLLRWPRRTS